MLLPPTANDRRCALADWLELRALFSERRLSSKGDLSNVFDIADEGGAHPDWADPDTGELLDADILDEPRSALYEAVFSELEYRAATLGDSYPFTVDSHRMILAAAFHGDLHAGQVAYTFCLLATAMRERKFSNLAGLEAEILALPLHFQVCACIAAGGYFGGAVSSFGFPRPERDAFLPALKRVYERFGYGDPKTTIEPGLPAAIKDGGIDVIAWRDHPDKLPGKLYSLGQTASGLNWQNKSVVEDVTPFHQDWFTNQPAAFYLPALYIPFVAYHDLDEYPGEIYREAKVRKVASNERRFGVVFDRLRIAHHVNEGMRTSDAACVVDGKDKLTDVAQWVNVAVGKVVALGATA